MKQKTRVIICVGAGGVGKTTMASVLGLHHAISGKRVLVITVDPARRLLDALGIAANNDGGPQRVDETRFGISFVAGGELHAFMPDLRQEWTDFLMSAVSGDERTNIEENPFFHYMKEGLPGSFEIICSHVMSRMLTEGDYDVIVLDTPPSSHSLSFFEVPKKIERVLQHNIFRLLAKNRNSFLVRMTKKMVFFSGSLLESTFEKLIGSHFLSRLIDFALTIDKLYEPMLRRCKMMDACLNSDDTRYVLVMRPSEASVNDGCNLQRALKKRGISIDEVVINQTLPTFDMEKIAREIHDFHDECTKKIIALYHHEYRREQKLIREIGVSFPEIEQHVVCKSESDARTTHLATLLNNYRGQL